MKKTGLLLMISTVIVLGSCASSGSSTGFRKNDGMKSKSFSVVPTSKGGKSYCKQ